MSAHTRRLGAGSSTHLCVLVLSLLGVGCATDLREGNFVVRGEDDLETLARYTQVTGTIVVSGTFIGALVLPKLERAGGLVLEENAPHLRTVSLPALREVELLALRDNPFLERLEAPRLTTLTTLELNGCDALEAFDLPRVESLVRLEVGRNRHLRSLNLPVLSRLVTAHFYSNNSLETLALPSLTAVESSLSVFGHAALSAIVLPSLTKLEGLSVSQNGALRSIRLDVLNELEDIELEDNPVLTRVHTPALRVRIPPRAFESKMASTEVADPEAFFSQRGDLRQLVVTRAGDERRLVLGYHRQGRAVFAARDASSGEVMWTTTLAPPADSRRVPPTSWPTTIGGSSGPDLVTVHLDDGHLHVVGLDPRTGAELWRKHGSRSWVVGRAVVTDGETRSGIRTFPSWEPSPADARPELMLRVPDGHGLFGIHKLGDLQAVALRLNDIFQVVTIDPQGSAVRFGFRDEPLIGANGQLVMHCDRHLSLEGHDLLTARFQPCPDLASQQGPIPPPLAPSARGILDLEPSGMRYLAVTDGRAAPKPLRWGGALIEPAHEGVVPVAFTGSRLAFVVYDQAEPPVQDHLWIASLDEAAPSMPSMRAVEGLDNVLVSGRATVLGRHLAFLTRHGGQGQRTLRLVGLESAAVELSMPLELVVEKGNRPGLVSNDGLIGFDLELELMGRVTVWIEAPAPPSERHDGPAARPVVVAAYQLRDAGDRHRAVEIDLTHGPETRALGEGLHAVRLRVGAAQQPNEAYDPDGSGLGGEHNPKLVMRDVHGGAFIDVRARRLV